MLALFSTGWVEVGSCLLFDEDREGMLRKDLFFFGTSVGFRTVCEDVSFDVGIESALAVGDSVGPVAGSIGLGICEESKHCVVRKSA
jgi:hypothetical protein